MTKIFKKKASFDGNRFYNYKEDDFQKKIYKKSLFGFFKWRIDRKKYIQAWPKWIENKKYDLPILEKNSNQIIASFINHSTVLIQIEGINILTDPVWSNRVSPFSFIGPKRVRDPGLTLDQLPNIDLILISHDHYDHLDIESLKILRDKFNPKIISGLNINKVLNKHNMNCIELDWWDKTNFKDLDIHFLPAKHWSGRKGFFGNNSTLWGSFMIKSPQKQIYFAGDTAYSNHIKNINEEFGTIDLALLPIGAYEPRWFMKESHTNPYEAALIHKELDSRNSIAVHYGTFRLSDESYTDPINDLKKAVDELSLEFPFHILEPGESLII